MSSILSITNIKIINKAIIYTLALYNLSLLITLRKRHGLLLQLGSVDNDQKYFSPVWIAHVNHLSAHSLLWQHCSLTRRSKSSAVIKSTPGSNDKPSRLCSLFFGEGAIRARAKLCRRSQRKWEVGQAVIVDNQNHQKRSCGQLLNQWLVLPTGVSL